MRAGLLVKAGPGHEQDARCLQELHAPVLVSRHPPLLRLLAEQRRQAERRKRVHGARDLVRLDSLHLVDPRVQHLRPRLQAVEKPVVLRVPRRVRRVALDRRVHHQVDHDLPVHVRAQRDRRHLHQRLHRHLREVAHLHVPAAAPALPDDALRHGVERDERQRRELTGHDALERHERPLCAVDVLLVHLVGQHHEAVLLSELAHFADLVPRQHVARGVAGVDDRHRLHLHAAVTRLLHRRPHRLHVQRPLAVLRQVVRHGGPALHGDSRGVQGVLRDGQHHAAVRRRDQHAEDQLDARRRAVCQEDVLRLRSHAVATLQRLRQVAAHPVVAEGACVRTRHVRVPDGRHHLLRTPHGVRRDAVCLVEHPRAVHQGGHLPVVRDGLLQHRLRVADVARDDLLEGEVGAALGKLLLDLVAARDEASTHCVLCLKHRRVDPVLEAAGGGQRLDGGGAGRRHFARRLHRGLCPLDGGPEHFSEERGVVCVCVCV
eukprot:Rhum_TRINITY_DN14497_c10_g1::Rhum_TRINITY_DN14497_c10_g1_i3::g.93134::m.93134